MWHNTRSGTPKMVFYGPFYRSEFDDLEQGQADLVGGGLVAGKPLISPVVADQYFLPFAGLK